jgi:non-specific serine/threonine protein kinase
LAGVASAQGDGKRALELSVESLALARELGGTDLGHMLLNSGYEFLLQGDYERAMALNEEAAALAREQGDKYRLHYSLDNLGWAALMRGDHRHARASFRENLVLCQELHDKLIASESLEGLACILGARRNAERTAKLFGAAETLREAVGFSQSSAQRALREPYLAAARSQLDEAAWEAAFAEGQKMTFEEAVEYALASEERSLTSTPVPKKSLADEQAIVLTRREEEIAVRVAQGLTNRQIATELMISEHTAATHVRRVLKKLGLRSRAQIGSWLTDRSPTADPN